MDVVKFIEERKRMCKSFGNRCTGCPAYEAPANGCGCVVDLESTLDATVQIAIVEKWSAEHPYKTRQNEFLKQWPNAKCVDNILTFCPKMIDISLSCSTYSKLLIALIVVVDFGCRRQNDY